MGKTSKLAARLAAFENMRRTAQENGVHMLPVERIADELYFRDDRLREYRNVDDPLDNFSFGERVGVEFVREKAMEDRRFFGLS